MDSDQLTEAVLCTNTDEDCRGKQSILQERGDIPVVELQSHACEDACMQWNSLDAVGLCPIAVRHGTATSCQIEQCRCHDQSWNPL